MEIHKFKKFYLIDLDYFLKIHSILKDSLKVIMDNKITQEIKAFSWHLFFSLLLNMLIINQIFKQLTKYPWVSHNLFEVKLLKVLYTI